MNWEFCWFLFSLLWCAISLGSYWVMMDCVERAQESKSEADLAQAEIGFLKEELADAKWKLEDIRNKINNPSPN